MKFYIKYIIVVFGFLMSCSEGDNEVPDYLIEREKMVEVISEIELTQALVKLKFTSKDTINSQELYNQVYQKFDISEEQFNKSLAYYAKKPKATEGIYIEAIERLSVEQAERKD